MSRKGIPRGTPSSEEDFKKKLYSAHESRVTLIGDYVKSNVKTKFLCGKCDSPFESTPNNALRGYKKGCSHCIRSVVAKESSSKAKNAYADKVDKAFFGRFVVVGEYRDAFHPIQHKCKACDHVISAAPNRVLSNMSMSCPNCNLMKDPLSIGSRTAMGMSFSDAVMAAYPALKFHKIGRTGGSLAEYTCSVCSTRQKKKIQELRQSPCRPCGLVLKAVNKRLSHEEYADRVQTQHSNNIQIIGRYFDYHKRIRHKCMRCFHMWKAKPIHILTTTIACPKCVWEVRKTNCEQGAVMREFLLGDRLVRVQGFEPQGLSHMVNNMGYDPDDLVVESEGGVPTVEYKIRTRRRRYYPDVYVKSDNAIVEIKSTYTLGLGKTKKHKQNWSMTCAKARACHEAGYKFALLLMDMQGNCTRLPRRWAYMSASKVMDLLKLGRKK